MRYTIGLPQDVIDQSGRHSYAGINESRPHTTGATVRAAFRRYRSLPMPYGSAHVRVYDAKTGTLSTVPDDLLAATPWAQGR